MKRLHKCLNWFMLFSIILGNSPLIYAEEIGQAIEQAQLDVTYQQAVEEANQQTVGSENANTEKPSSEQTEPSTKKEKEDAINSLKWW